MKVKHKNKKPTVQIDSVIRDKERGLGNLRIASQARKRCVFLVVYRITASIGQGQIKEGEDCAVHVPSKYKNDVS